LLVFIIVIVVAHIQRRRRAQAARNLFPKQISAAQRYTSLGGTHGSSPQPVIPIQTLHTDSIYASPASRLGTAWQADEWDGKIYSMHSEYAVPMSGPVAPPRAEPSSVAILNHPWSNGDYGAMHGAYPVAGLYAQPNVERAGAGALALASYYVIPNAFGTSSSDPLSSSSSSDVYAQPGGGKIMAEGSALAQQSTQAGSSRPSIIPPAPRPQTAGSAVASNSGAPGPMQPASYEYVSFDQFPLSSAISSDTVTYDVGSAAEPSLSSPYAQLAQALTQLSSSPMVGDQRALDGAEYHMPVFKSTAAFNALSQARMDPVGANADAGASTIVYVPAQSGYVSLAQAPQQVSPSHGAPDYEQATDGHASVVLPGAASSGAFETMFASSLLPEQELLFRDTRV
jgi:hypothetical protein